jgi:hypothetical protein
MVKMITATESLVIHSALKDAYKTMIELGVDEEDLEDLKYALQIFKGLKEKTIEEFLGVKE